MLGAVRLRLDENLAHVQPGGPCHQQDLPAPLLEGLCPAADSYPPLAGLPRNAFPICALHAQAEPLAADAVIKMRSGWQLRKGGVRPAEARWTASVTAHLRKVTSSASTATSSSATAA